MPPSAPSPRRILVASLIGTAVEFYDFYIYATAASLVFGGLFFPSVSPTAQQLAAYASFGIAFLARPLGASVFGHFGDRVGRKTTLVASLLVMGLSTLTIAFLPTYADVGWVAPLLLCLLRFGQGFGLGGEWGGAALLAVENAPAGKRARFGMFPQLGAPVGFVASNGVFLLLSWLMPPAAFVRWGWRLPFVASALLVGVGLWVRVRLTETPAFLRAARAQPPVRVPLIEVVTRHPRALVAGTFAVVACYAIFYLSTTFALGYATTTLHQPRTAFLGVQLLAILFMAAGIVAAGVLADRWTPRRVLLGGCVGTIPAGFLLEPLFGRGGLVGAGVMLSLALALMGFVYGPLGAWLPGLFPARVRYTGASVAFNVGGILGGALAPAAAQALAWRGGLAYVGLYLSASALVSGVALLSMRGVAPPDTDSA